MKVKKLTLAIATILSFSTLAACSNNNKIIFNDYWKANSESNETVKESLEYDVTFTKGVGFDSLNYKLSYGTGKYVTTLESTNSNEYVYTTQLTMPVQYEYNGEKTEEFSDIVTTKIRFQKKALTPISSEKTVISHSPIGGNATSLESAFVEYNFTITTNYDTNGNGTSAIVYQKTTDMEAHNDKPNTFSILSDKYNYLDNEQLLLGLRAIQSSTSSGKVLCHNPFLKKVQTVNFSFQAAESAAFSFKLNDKELKGETISHRKATLTLDETNPGATQTVKIAAVTNAANNVYRNLILSLETPIAYSMGTLVYTLTSAQFI